MISRSDIARFDAKCLPEPNSGCLLWLGSTDKKGYGNFWAGGRFEKPHRFALRRTGVVLPDGCDVCHRCDTPSCVNPEHLFVGSRRDNVADMVAKRRGSVAYRCGTAHGMAKLNDDLVGEIRRLNGRMSITDLAALYGVDRKTIYNIHRGLGWKRPSGLEWKPRSQQC